MSDETRLGGILERTDFWNGEESRDLLRCPVCGDDYTHLDRTMVYQRKEDGDTTRVTVGAADDVIRGGPQDNPSPRRDAVVLHFEGECGHEFTVTFIQHKGNTYAWATTLSKPA